MIVTAATSATPMVSAEAVMAVRPGARMALRRASMAAGPPVASHRAPEGADDGRARCAPAGAAGARRRSASRSASTGATRVARHAGTQAGDAASRAMPTSSDTTIVRVANTVPGLRQVEARAP